MIVVDTGALYAVVDSSEPDHSRVTEILDRAAESFVTTPLVLAELDHLLGRRLGEAVRSRVMGRLSRGGPAVSVFDAAAFTMAAQVADMYGDLPLGLTDASVMVAAQRHGTRRLLTLDRRHFRAVRPIGVDTEPFVLLPDDGEETPAPGSLRASVGRPASRTARRAGTDRP